NLDTFKSSNNLSTIDMTVIADVNGDGYVTYADLQALLNSLRGGGGSFNQDENTTALVDSTTPITPTLIPSPEVNNQVAPIAGADATLTTNSTPSSYIIAPSPSNTTATSRRLIPVIDAKGKTELDSASTSNATFANHLPATTADQAQVSLALLDFYFSWLDHSTLQRAKAKRPAGRFALVADGSLADASLEPLSDSATDCYTNLYFG
ncbi:MAG TPA: hypothetical protein VMJ32_01115, partial [Pirellulales bacterium]|nr:hypothetical protein [Pirellulales bacterium]